MRLSAVLLALAITASARAATADTPVLIETDPATFALGGFAAHVRVLPGRGHLAVGGGLYALDLPKALVDLDAKNRDQGFAVRLALGGAAFADYYLREDAAGWFFGVELAAQRYRYTNAHAPGEAAIATDLIVMPRAGYQWQPFASGFYVMPWFGLGYLAEVAGGRQVGMQTYDLRPWIPYGAVHLGWKF